MDESVLMKKLERVDDELHSLMSELKRPKKPMPLSALNKLMEKDRVSDADSTRLIREMRDKEYD